MKPCMLPTFTTGVHRSRRPFFVTSAIAVTSDPPSLSPPPPPRLLAPARLEVANLGEAGSGRYRTTPFGQLGPLLPGGAGSSVDSGALSAALAVQSGAADQLQALLGRLERSERDTAAAYRELEELRVRLADHQAAERWPVRDGGDRIFFFYKFCPNPLIGRIDKDRAPAKQSLLRWPCPLPSDRAIPGLWQNLESKV